MPATPRLFVVSGPSGAGKGTLLSLVRESRPDLALTVSATTRKPRKGEIDGVSYRFLSDEEFDAELAAGNFLEWANVHDHRYGTLRSDCDDKLASGRSVVLEIDVQGALNVRKAYPEAVLIFREPPSLEVLEQRLRDRGSEDEESRATRLENARGEMALESEYDERIVNDSKERAAEELSRIFDKYENM